MSNRPRVVIVGGGFGGLLAARTLRRAPVDVTLIDRRNHHLFQPLLYQVATGGLSPADIAAPLRGILCRQRNARVLLAEVRDFDTHRKRVILSGLGGAPTAAGAAEPAREDEEIAYDYLIVATGASHNYFGNPHWASIAPGLKDIEDATEIRGRILLAFEQAELLAARGKRDDSWLTFAIIGAGPTGVELAGAIAEVARDTIKHDFRQINPRDARILLLDASDRVLPTYPAELSWRAKRSLERLGVTVWTGVRVTDVQRDGVVIQTGAQSERIGTHTVLWAAGVQASALGGVLSQRVGVQLDRAGRVLVERDLTVPGCADIFVIGDLASLNDDTGRGLPGTAPVAMQQGRFVARRIRWTVENERRAMPDALRRFRYQHKGNLATIGRAAGVADFGRLRFSGYPAWLLWLFVHILFIVEFEDRVLIVIQWAWNYWTRNRSARLITGDAARNALR